MAKAKLATIEEYISTFSKEIQLILKQVQLNIIEAVPEAVQCISYGIPAFKKNGKSVYFAGYKNYLSMYPMYGLPDLEAEIQPYRAKGTKDTIHFLYSKTLPIDLIVKIAKAKLN